MFRIVVCISCFAASLHSMAQEIHYFGNEELLKEIADGDREKPFSTFGKVEDICEQYIYQIDNVVVKGQTYLILGLTSSFGHSCKNTSKIVFIKKKRVYGYYPNDITYPKKIEDNRIVCEYEGGREFVIELKNGIPDTLLFEAQMSTQFIKVEND